MNEISIIIRTADRAHKAEVTVADTQTSGDMIEAAINNWVMDRDRDYTIVNVSKTPPQSLIPSHSLADAGVQPGDTLEIQPILVAGEN